jgi:hypothetical protein
MKKLYLFLGAFCVIALVLGYFWLDRESTPTAEFVPTTEFKAVAQVPKVAIVPKSIQVYGQTAKAKLHLPQVIQDDKNVSVVSATVVAPDDNPLTVTTLINSDTGDTQTLIRREPKPWLALKRTGAIRLDYGFRGVNRVARLSVRQDVLQVKSFYAGVTASFDSDGQVFAGIGFEYRW